MRFILRSFATLLVMAFLCSCQKEESPVQVEQPSVSFNEVGADNSKIAYSGHDLHLDADIKAPGKIESIKLQITLAETNYGWDFVNTYTDHYAGLTEANFHEHLHIPDNARAGTYTLLIVVTDENGQKSLGKINFEIIKDLSLPSIKGLSFAFSEPSTIQLSGDINAPNKIENVEVEVQSSAWTKLFTYAEADMVGKTSFNFNKDINISDAPAGHYHVNVKLNDQAAKHITYSYHFDYLHTTSE